MPRQQRGIREPQTRIRCDCFRRTRSLGRTLCPRRRHVRGMEASKSFVCGRVPCLTYSKTAGLWVTNRGRRMTPSECMRIQGISSRQTTGLPDTFVRACVGNSMTVPVVSALVDAALSLVSTVKQAPLAVAQSATIENSRRGRGRLAQPSPVKRSTPLLDSTPLYNR